MKIICFLYSVSIILFNCSVPYTKFALKYENVELNAKNLGIGFISDSISFGFMKSSLTIGTKNFQPNTGLQLNTSDNLAEDFPHLFTRFSTSNVSKYSKIEKIVKLSPSAISKIWGKIKKDKLKATFSEIDIGYESLNYILLFEAFYVTYNENGCHFTLPSGKCTPELIADYKYWICSIENGDVVANGSERAYVEYIDPKTGMFSKPEPSIYNVRYNDWELLFKQVIRGILRNIKFS